MRSQALQEAQELARQQQAEATQRDEQKEEERRAAAAKQEEEARTLAVAAEAEKRARVEAEAKAQQEAKLEALLSDADRASREAEAMVERDAAEAAQRKAAALAQHAEGLLRQGHDANKGGDFAKARRCFQEAHALQKKPAALVSAANMALKMGEASTAKREYEQALKAEGLGEKLKAAINTKLQEATQLMDKQIRDEVQREAEAAAARIATEDAIRSLATQPLMEIDVAAANKHVAAAVGYGFEAADVEVAKARVAEAAKVQEAERVKQEKARKAAEEKARAEAKRALSAASPSKLADVDVDALRAAVEQARAVALPQADVDAAVFWLSQAERWHKADAALTAAMAPAVDDVDVAALRKAVGEAQSVKLPGAEEGATKLKAAEEAAAERKRKYLMRRESEKMLNAAMPGMFGKPDEKKLAKAIEVAKGAGADERQVAAAEAKLKEIELQKKRSEERLAAEQAQRSRLEAEEAAFAARVEAARKEAEAKAKREAEERALAAAAETARREVEQKAKLAAEAEARRAAEAEAARLAALAEQRAAAERAKSEAEEAARREAHAKRRHEATTELKRASEGPLAALDIARLAGALDAAAEAGVEGGVIEAAQEVMAQAQRRALAKEKLAAASAPAADDVDVVTLRAAVQEAQAVGLPAVAQATQKLKEAEAAVERRQKDAAAEAARREAAERARREADAELRASLPGLFGGGDSARLRAAIEQARAAGVAPASVSSAEAELLRLLGKEEAAEERNRLAAAEAARREAARREAEERAAAEAARREAEAEQKRAADEEAALHSRLEKELKAAAGLDRLFGSAEVTDVARLEAAIDAARAAAVTSEMLGKAEAKLAAIRIDASRKASSFERMQAQEAARREAEAAERKKASFEREQRQQHEQAEAAPPGPAPPARSRAPPVAPRRARGGFAATSGVGAGAAKEEGASSHLMGGAVGDGPKKIAPKTQPLPFAPSAPGMMAKLKARSSENLFEGAADGADGGAAPPPPARTGGFSAVAGAGGQQASGPKKISRPSAPLKFAPGAGGPAKAPVRMQRRGTGE